MKEIKLLEIIKFFKGEECLMRSVQKRCRNAQMGFNPVSASQLVKNDALSIMKDKISKQPGNGNATISLTDYNQYFDLYFIDSARAYSYIFMGSILLIAFFLGIFFIVPGLIMLAINKRSIAKLEMKLDLK